MSGDLVRLACHVVNSSMDPISATPGLLPEMCNMCSVQRTRKSPIIIMSSYCKVPLPYRVTMRSRACGLLTGHHELVQDGHRGSDKDRSRAQSKASTVNSGPVTQITRKKETFIYNHGSPTGVHTACTNKMNLQVKSTRALCWPQCPILTTITVTLSAEPRCTALLASLLHAAS